MTLSFKIEGIVIVFFFIKESPTIRNKIKINDLEKTSLAISKFKKILGIIIKTTPISKSWTSFSIFLKDDNICIWVSFISKMIIIEHTK